MDPPTGSVLQLVMMMVVVLPPVVSLPCPRPCSCPHPVELHCTFRSLTGVPATVPKQVMRMNLGFNSINGIAEKSLAGLRKLELFMIHGNEIQVLPAGVFKDLTSLQMLKMSYNKLTEITRETFQGLWSLTRLHLDHNQLESIHPHTFQGLTSLRLLQLEGNRLQQLHPASFSTFTVMGSFHISTVRHLYLSDNHLASLNPGLLASAPQLENLYLQGNPWRCDCHMKWLHSWNTTAEGVLKCKKDRALPGGQLCPMCSSPKHLQKRELPAVESLQCSPPVISSAHRTSSPENEEREVLTLEDLREPLGSVSLGLSDEHGNEVDLECRIEEPKELGKVSWELEDQSHLTANISASVDLDCPVDREKYEQLWRLIAYYSAVPAHLQRGAILSKDPHPTYVFRQDSEKDALYYTGVRVNMMAQPEWLMQPSVDLQLNRPQSSAKAVKLTLSTELSEEVDLETMRRQRRTWVMIESTNTTQTMLSALLGSPIELFCGVQSSGKPLVQWMLPDGSKLEASYSRPENRVSVHNDGRLIIKAVGHKDAGVYYCISRVEGDLAVLPFHLAVKDSSGPAPGEDTPIVERPLGSPISLPCETSGSPDAEVHWILPNNNIVSSKTNSSRASVHLNGMLHIAKLLPLDGGYYKCLAMNEHGVDALTTRVNIGKHRGILRPFQKFPAQPQSASGVSTQITVLSGDTEEVSGDGEVFQEEASINQDPIRRRTAGSVSPGRRGLQPTRNMRRRPPVLHRAAATRVTERKNPVQSRRRVNVSKSKIDPEKWADILAKIRDRNAATTVTAVPERTATQRSTRASDGVAVFEKRDQNVTTTFTPPQVPQIETNQHIKSQSTHVTSETHTTQNPTPDSQHSAQATTQALSTLSGQSERHTAHDTHLEGHPGFLPQTTSDPSHTVTLWQDVSNTASSRTASLQDSEPDGVQTVDWSDVTEPMHHSDSVDKSHVTAGESFVEGSEIIPSVDPNQSATSQTHNGKHLSFTEESQTSFDDLQAQQTLTTASTTALSTQSRSEQGNGRRRNGGRRRGPNRRKHKLSRLAAQVNPTAASRWRAEPLEVTTALLSSTVPFTESQVASSGTLSHKASEVPPQGRDEAIKPSSHKKSTQTKRRRPSSAKPLFQSTSEAPFLKTSPGVAHGKMNSHTEAVLEHSVPLLRLTGSLPPAAPPSQDTPATLDPEGPGLEPHPGGFHLQTQTDGMRNQSGDGDTAVPSEETDMGFTASPPPFTSSQTSGYSSGAVITTLSTLSSTDQVTTERPGSWFDGQHETSSRAPVEDLNMEDNDPVTTAPPTTATSVPDSVIPSTITPSTTSSTSDVISPAVQTTFMTVSQNQDRHFTSIAATSESHRGSDFSPAGRHSTVSSQTTPPPAPVPSEPSTETPPTSMDQGGRLPERAPPPPGKPKITKNNFQTLAVKAETDAVLPCEAEGEPMPFLSWTKVSTGASIARNMRVQRFEVHQNGTLMIRKTEISDQNQYVCTVQNQYGTDRMAVDLVVLSQQPRVLQPPHRDISVDVGAKVDLECAVEGHPRPQVTWVLPSHAHLAAGTTSNQRLAVLDDGTLRIGEVRYIDRGVYKCLASSAAGEDSVSVRLHVSVLPPVIQQAVHENVSRPEGGSILFHCSASGAPPPVIRWTAPDGVQLTGSQPAAAHNMLVFSNGTLHIRELGPGNAGRYECLASNAVAHARRSVILSVRKNATSAKARIRWSSPQRTDVVYGSTVLLHCEAEGRPDPRIIWRTPSKSLVDIQYSVDPRIKVFSNGSLSIRSVTDRDGGDYLCAARNKLGDDYILLRLNVLTRAAKIEHKQQRSSQEVLYGGDLKVDCVASGLPYPEISWALPDGTMVNPVKQKDGGGGGRSRRYVVFDNGTLYLNMPEEGDYTCYAENRLGKDEMKVRVKIKTGASAPQIHGKDGENLSVYYGETVMLRCDADGEPAPVITWISPTNRVIAPAPDKYQFLDGGTLVVQKVQRFDAGNYTCLARNKAGHAHKVARLEVVVTPPVINGFRGASSAIKVSAVQDRQTLLDCVAKGTPTPRIMWVLPGNVILPAPYYSNRMAVHLNGTLEIRSPKKTDSGQLTCIARNEGGEVKMVVDLTVKEAMARPLVQGPEVERQPLSVGNTVTLNCSLEGTPLSHVTWILPSGTPLTAGARLSKFFHRPDGSLIISNPSVAEVGSYKCLGRYAGGLMERTVTLSPGKKPEIKNRYDSPVGVMNGKTLLLHCQTVGDAIGLSWTLPSGVLLNRPQRAGRYAVLPNGTLAIQTVSLYDRGPYTCRAANEYGSALLSVSVVVVAFPPRITNGPPSVTYAKRGVAIQINCIATGMPKAEVAWETPDKMRLAVGAQPRLFGNKYLHPQGSLIIQNPTARDAGVYRCTAKNAIGVDSKATFLNVF